MKVLISVPWDKNQLQRVRQAYPDLEFVQALDEAGILEAIADTEVVFGELSRAAFLRARRLRWIQCHGAGVNKLVAIPELVAGDVRVTNTSGAHAPAIAEHFFGALLALTRQFPALYAAQQRSEWIPWSNWPVQVGPMPISIFGLTLGVIGFGHIGQAIATRGAAFGMQVRAIDRRVLPPPPYLAEVWGVERLPQLLGEVDVVAVTVPGTPESDGMLGREMLALLRPGAYLGVVSRGGIVDETALAEMLTAGKLAGAILDVFQTEPLPPSSPLWKAPNLILTPHCSGKSEYTTAAATTIFIENLGRYLDGSPFINLVDKQSGY